MFEGFIEEDFKDIDGTRRFDDSAINSIKQKLSDFGLLLTKEIYNRWGTKFRSLSGRTSNLAKVNELIMILTQEPGSGYLSYPRFVLQVNTDGMKIFFILMGHSDDNIDSESDIDPESEIVFFSKMDFYHNFLKNAKDYTFFLEQNQIDISDLDFKESKFNSLDYITLSHEPLELIKMSNDQLIELIMNDLEKILPLYNMAIKGMLPIVEKNKEKATLKSTNHIVLKIKKQTILYGPPGTGKTYNTKEYSIHIIFHGDETMLSLNQDEINRQYDDLRSKGQIEFITFHPSYSYEEFVEGITVDVKTTNVLKYELKQGIFKKMVIKSIARALYPDLQEDKLKNLSLDKLMEEYRAEINQISSQINGSKEKSAAIKEWWEEKTRFVLIIDEINRGDISKIFGELITLLEADKRLGMENELTARLPYSQEEFGIPPNLYIIGTMNTADKSIALIDIALRRRFGFIEMAPDLEILDKYINENKSSIADDVYDGLDKSIKVLKQINEKISKDPSVGRDRQIGHSFLFKVQTQKDLILVWKHEILPLLEEYYYGQYHRINQLLFSKEESNWIKEMEGISDFATYEDLIRFLDSVK